MTREQKREALKERVAAAQARFDDRTPEEIAAKAASSAINFAKQNPAVVIGGATVIAFAIAKLSRGSRKAKTNNGVFSRFATDTIIGFALAMYEKANAQESEVGIAKGQDLIEQKPD